MRIDKNPMSLSGNSVDRRTDLQMHGVRIGKQTLSLVAQGVHDTFEICAMEMYTSSLGGLLLCGAP